MAIKASSRLRSGAVPNVNFNNDNKVNVNYYNTDNYNDNLRAREVVSIKKARLKEGLLNLFKIFYPAISHFGYSLEIGLEVKVFFWLDNF